MFVSVSVFVCCVLEWWIKYTLMKCSEWLSIEHCLFEMRILLKQSRALGITAILECTVSNVSICHVECTRIRLKRRYFFSADILCYFELSTLNNHANRMYKILGTCRLRFPETLLTYPWNEFVNIFIFYHTVCSSFLQQKMRKNSAKSQTICFIVSRLRS